MVFRGTKCEFPNTLREGRPTVKEILQRMGLAETESGVRIGSEILEGKGGERPAVTPITGETLARVRTASRDEYERVSEAAAAAFREWRMVPAPRRGEIVRRIGEALRREKAALGALVSLEVGKIRAEGEGEVQEMIDMADFAAGQSRMLYGRTMPSERPGHRIFEQWHPLGPVGVVTAFNFPVAVWSWNAMNALIAGDCLIWKPSAKAPLTAIAVARIFAETLRENGAPDGVVNLVVGDRESVGEAMIHDPRIPLISATGSVAMGRKVAEAAGRRLGRSLLELGGNNGVIVAPSADLDLTVRAILFGAVGTAGQRCTTIRRAIVHESIREALTRRLVDAYARIPVGNPLESDILMGPIIDRAAVSTLRSALDTIRAQGGEILHGGETLSGGLYDAGTYVFPCIAAATPDMPIVREETFAPLLYIQEYDTFENAVAIHNAVPQGLSSAVFTSDIGEMEAFLGPAGSDCGLANVNIGTSGAEIGGAFGGEKETGGGREAGSDAWKAYMRRQTCTVNGSGEMPLAQGVRFDLEGHG
jgi:aldehyde dehydrogenase (NAD+)